MFAQFDKNHIMYKILSSSQGLYVNIVNIYSYRSNSRIPNRLGEDSDAEPENRLLHRGTDVPQQL